MIDARTFSADIEEARKILEGNGAILKGEYAIHDIIFAPKDADMTLADEFLRLRLVPKNIWNEKPFIVAIKRTALKTVGKESAIPLRQDFDTEASARKYITENLADTFDFSFEFDRIGWQYDMGTNQVDLEIIEGRHPSIEFKSPTEEGLAKLLELFGNPKIMPGPSVVAIKELLEIAA